MSWSYIDWAEKAGIECLKGRLETAAFLQKEATTLLSILLVGIGGGIGYSAKLFDGSLSPWTWGIAASAGWLCVVAVFLMLKCIKTTNTQLLYNLPLNIYQPDLGWTEMQVREAEMRNVHERILITIESNDRRAIWLDRARYMAIATPLVFGLATAITSI
ncbi:hypothetical protein ABE501_18580 [Comamonas testosteroni]